MCLKIMQDGIEGREHWTVLGGCYDNDEMLLYGKGAPNHQYNFKRIYLELHPQLKEEDKRPIMKVEPVDVSNHWFLQFLKWLFLILAIICLIVGIVMLVLWFLHW